MGLVSLTTRTTVIVIAVRDVFCTQALPYVALLIVMLFFIFAVIGMQVSILLLSDTSIILITLACFVSVIRWLVPP